MLVKLKKAIGNFKRLLFPQDYLEKLLKRGLVVGKNFNMQQGVILDDSHCWHIRIGDDVTLAPHVHILAHDASPKSFIGYTKIGKVDIGNKVFIGASSIVLSGVVIGDNVVIGAGSLVNIDIPSNSVAVGNPVKIVSSLNEFIQNKEKELEIYPNFDESYIYTERRSKSKLLKMNETMQNRFGFIR